MNIPENTSKNSATHFALVELNTWLTARGCRPIPDDLTERKDIIEAINVSIHNTAIKDLNITAEIKSTILEFDGYFNKYFADNTLNSQMGLPAKK